MKGLSREFTAGSMVSNYENLSNHPTSIATEVSGSPKMKARDFHEIEEYLESKKKNPSILMQTNKRY